MSLRLSGPIVVLFAMTVPHAGDAAVAAPERVPIEWKRDPKVAVPRVDAPPPDAPEPPADLGVASGGTGPRVDPSRRTEPPGPGPAIDDLAMRAGEAMADEAARVWGWREHWRAGFVRGASAALDDPRVGAWDYEEGVRFGRSDPRARILGDRLANEAAGRPAELAAEARVREQFMDLASEPRRDRAGFRGASSPRAVPTFVGPWAAEPVLDDVVVSYPPGRAPGLSRDGRRAVEAWPDAARSIARRDRETRVYDVRWKDPEPAFAVWRGRQRRGSAWSGLTSREQERFRIVFLDRFEATLRSSDPRAYRDAWRAGFADGWRYGAAIQAEWSYRRGYSEGFDLAVTETAAIAFPYAYDRAYAEAYDRWFADWTAHPHPGLGEVRLEDDNEDGIFEPGERLRAFVEVVNYGGGAGSFELIASGSGLVATKATTVRTPGRGRGATAQTLSLAVDLGVPSRTRTTVTVVFGDARADVPLYISRPLEFAGASRIDADRIGGRVTLGVAVVNTSRLAAPASVRVDPLTGHPGAREDDLGVIPAGGSRQASVTFEGIHPLDLIGGDSRWRASVLRGTTIDDVREVGIAPVATDLSNPDLMDFMLALAATPDVSRSDVADARELMMDRLRADWDRAAAASGNPYKRDFDAHGAETVLGELVRSTERRRSFVSPQVFDGMDRDVEALGDELPGAHPLLRKWMKKLARRLG